jgi:ubiquinone/menaquinone biosynthesis C-methylase UbiE
MAHRVCPWWLGYLLLNPLRRLRHPAAKILGPYVQAGMTVLEPGPGMGYFTLDLARRVGPSGRVVAVDIQPRMLEKLKRRAAKAGLLGRLDLRLAQQDSMGLADLAGGADFVLAFAMVHEIPSPAAFFHEAARALKPGGRLLLAEPAGHVSRDNYEAELAAAAQAGLHLREQPAIRRSYAALLEKAASARAR